MTKNKRESPAYALQMLREYIAHDRVYIKDALNLREIVQNENTMSFKAGQAIGKITLGKPDKKVFYDSKLELHVDGFKPDYKTITLEVKKSRQGRITDSSFSLFEDYIKKIGSFLSNYNLTKEPIKNDEKIQKNSKQ
jgi:hypothetical protein